MSIALVTLRGKDHTDYTINWQLEQEMEAMKVKLAAEKKLSQGK